MRLIDADELKSDFLREAERPINERPCVMDIIDNAPTIDAEPVRHGQWEEKFDSLMCSECKAVFKDEIIYTGDFGRYYIPYCPNCGAKMDKYDEKSNG